MNIQDYCNGRIIQNVNLVLESGVIVAKVTFIGTEHYLIFRSAGTDKVGIELHDGK